MPVFSFYDPRVLDERAEKRRNRTGCRHVGREDDHCPCEDEEEADDD